MRTKMKEAGTGQTIDERGMIVAEGPRPWIIDRGTVEGIMQIAVLHIGYYVQGRTVTRV